MELAFTMGEGHHFGATGACLSYGTGSSCLSIVRLVMSFASLVVRYNGLASNRTWTAATAAYGILTLPN